jgi:hypothetical protein
MTPTIFEQGNWFLGLDATSVAIAVLFAIAASSAAPPLIIGSARICERLAGLFGFGMHPARRNMNKVGDFAHRHHYLVGQTLVEAGRAGLPLFIVAAIGFFTSEPLDIVGFWSGSARNMAVEHPLSAVGASFWAFLLHAFLAPILLQGSPMIARVRPDRWLRAIKVFALVGFASSLYFSGWDVSATLICFATGAALSAPVVIPLRGARLLGVYGLLWAPAAILGWLLEFLAMIAAGPVLMIFAPVICDRPISGGIGSGHARILMFTKGNGDLDWCHSVDTLEGMRRPA